MKTLIHKWNHWRAGGKCILIRMTGFIIWQNIFTSKQNSRTQRGLHMVLDLRSAYSHKYPENKYHWCPEFSCDLNSALQKQTDPNVLRGLRWDILTPGYAVNTSLIKTRENQINSDINSICSTLGTDHVSI